MPGTVLGTECIVVRDRLGIGNNLAEWSGKFLVRRKCI